MRKVSISVYLLNVTPEALDAICKSHDLWHKEDSTTGVIRIYTTKEYQRDLSSFREKEKTGVFTLLYPNPLDVANAIRSLYGDRVIINIQSLDQDRYQDLMLTDRFQLIAQQSQGFGLISGNNGIGGGSTGRWLGRWKWDIGGAAGGSSGLGGGYGGGGGGGGLGTLTRPSAGKRRQTAWARQ